MIKARLILDEPAPGKENMAKDKSLFEEAEADKNFPPTLRIYGWSAPTISIGRRQKVDDIDVKKCVLLGIDIVKRFGGGAAVFHNQEVTYCFVTRLDAMPMPEPERWRKIFSSILWNIGIQSDAPSECEKSGLPAACFSCAEPDEPTVKGKKWVGSARRKSKNVFLQHGSILIKSQPEKFYEFAGKPGADNSIGLAELKPGLAKEDAAGLLIQAIETELNLSFAIA